jgi:hypothetical protein
LAFSTDVEKCVLGEKRIDYFHSIGYFQQTLKSYFPMKDPEIEQKANEALLACLKEVPFVRVQAVDEDRHEEGVDLFFEVESEQRPTRLMVEARNIGQPRLVREAVKNLLRYKANCPEAYAVFVAPYISPQAAEICAKEGIGYLDLAGNCRLCFARVFISKEGKPNPLAQKRGLRSLYSPRAERVLRVLLADPSRAWKVQPLADEAKVSLGQAFNVKKLLTDREWTSTTEEGFSLGEPAKLLAEWETNYNPKRNETKEYYSMRPVAELERMLGRLCENQKIPYALAGFSSAARYAPMVRYQRAMAYVGENLNGVALALELKPVTSGANVSLMVPYDEGVRFGAENLGGTNVTSPIQTYLDLKQMKARGEEAAEFLKQQVIQPKWPANTQIT